MKTKFLLCTLFLFGLLFMPALTKAQFPVHVQMGNDVATTPGQQIIVPVKVSNFTNIGSMTLTILWDSAVLTYTGNTAWDSILNTGSYFCNSPVPGKFLLGWYSIFPLTIPDTTLLAGLQFTYIDGETVILFDTTSTNQCQFTDDNGLDLAATYINGSVNWPGNNPVCSNSITYTHAPDLGIVVTGTVVNASPVYHYFWNYGDGTTQLSTSNVIFHQYNVPGTYTVSLESRAYNFCVTTSSIQVTVLPPGIDGNIAALNALDTGRVDLYQWDNTSAGFLPYDSLQVNSSYSFPNIPIGNYLVKATPDSSSAYASTYIPTYYGDTPFWNDASLVIAFQMIGPYDIQLIPVLGPAPGPGIIGGTISTQFKSLSSGIPAEGIELLLTTTADVVQAVCYSNSNGAFEFNNLAYGTYLVRAEKTSLLSTPLNITLSAANPAVNNVIFEITPAGISTGIGVISNPLPLVMGAVYPNPATNILSFEIQSSREMEAGIEILNMLGQAIRLQRTVIASGNQHIDLNISDLLPGFYCLNLTLADGNVVRQKFSISR